MFGRNNELAKPPIAREKEARELLRVWGGANFPQQYVIQTMWDDPGVWGLLLVDLARHVAKAYEDSHGLTESETLDRIKELFDAEWLAPTDVPERVC